MLYFSGFSSGHYGPSPFSKSSSEFAKSLLVRPSDPFQESPDYRGELTLALQNSDLDAARAIREEWRVGALRWLKRKREDSNAENLQNKKKLHRTKAYEWLLASESMLKSIGKSWRGFEKPDTSKQPDPLTWPLITVCADQGGDGECALNWLQRQKHINVDRFSDPSHGVACGIRNCGGS